MSLRGSEEKSPRMLLANVPESSIDTSTAEGEITLAKLREYKQLINEKDRLEVERYEIYQKAEKLEWNEGKTEDEIKQMKNLFALANKLGNKINTLECQILELDTKDPLKAIKERETEKAYNEAAQRGREELERYREEKAKETRELIERWQKTRAEGNARRAKLAAEEKAKQEAEKERQRQELQRKEVQGNNLNYTLFQFFLMSASLNLPLIMINAPTWVLFLTIFFIFLPIIFMKDWLVFLVFHLYNIVRAVLYVWGIIVTVQGQQDFIAIAFYIIAGLQSISIIKNFIFTILTTIFNIIERNDK